MDKAKFTERLSEALDKDLSCAEGSTLLEELDWDSISSITFIALADELLGKKVDSSQVQNAKTLADLYKICF